jgi:GcrA cell cycle regulator
MSGAVTSEQDWTAEEMARLATLWNDGLPITAIAKALGRSKNSIVGKKHRLGLPIRDPAMGVLARLGREKAKQARAGLGAAHHAEVTAQSRAEAERRLAERAAAKAEAEERRRQAAEAEAEEAAEALRLRDAGAARRHGDGCRYIFGHPRAATAAEPWHFCGTPRRSGSPYCEAHHRICYRVKDEQA